MTGYWLLQPIVNISNRPIILIAYFHFDHSDIPTDLTLFPSGYVSWFGIMI